MIEYSMVTCGVEPQSYKEAMSRDHAVLWHEAAQNEIDALEKHGTWELCVFPSCWVFCRKETETWTSTRGRVIAEGFAQKPHLDYAETFAPVARFASLRTILAMAAAEDMEVHHMDVSSAFLNGTLDKEIFMYQVEGFAKAGQEHLVCRLKRPMYGLKQSPRQWYK